MVFRRPGDLEATLLRQLHELAHLPDGLARFLIGVDRSMLTAIENFVRWSAPQEITHQPGDQLGRLDQDAVTQVGQNLQL